MRQTEWKLGKHVKEMQALAITSEQSVLSSLNETTTTLSSDSLCRVSQAQTLKEQYLPQFFAP